MLPSTTLIESRLNSRPDPDTEFKARASIRALNDFVQANANEPSLAFYRIQEHVRKTMPNLVQKRIELEQLHERLNGLIFDVEYSADALKNLAKSNEHLDNITTYLQKSISLSKQVNLSKQRQIQQNLLEKKSTI